jgi:hypothetical protein
MSSGPVLIIRNTFYLHLQHLFIPKIQKHLSHLHLFLHIVYTTTITIPLYFWIAFILIYFLYIHSRYIIYIFVFNFNTEPCVWQPLGGVGSTNNTFVFLGCLKRKEKCKFYYFPKSSIWTIESPLWKNMVATLFYAWSPNKLVST